MFAVPETPEAVLEPRSGTSRGRDRAPQRSVMKAGIHPDYKTVTVHCACGASWTTRSTKGPDLRLEICSSCHPFFTGKQKLIDTEGRVDRFQKKYAKVREAAAAKKNQPVA